MDPASDAALIRRIAARDQTAMQVLYGRHHVRVYRFLLRILRNEAAAEDLVSDVFVDVWQQASRFEERAAVTTWLLSIARFKALSALRRRREDALDDDKAAGIEDDADTPEVTAQKSSKADAMQRCIAKLSRDHAEVIQLVYYHEQSVEEAAAVLGIPEATVKTRMFYARKRLSELLKAAGLDRGWP
ncbi:sigma-70 family RNA polymerase sigma factor [Enterovirga rhinocerotis]|uniref:RNA polymerase sigma-70 factor (ECF subfamily) n=1 Tax=Enterovirga rhinocerotis TaxID=1339210 RepID=A0A4R7BX07_9HYPH|nr:sigma-70 family RNA polymerase sigma factor [Enterovirga rhinocerotis]TDR90450.1 RNA polymerase sigma-70 factor (ECF subfamily) [Enterovirga rhinocerotis]